MSWLPEVWLLLYTQHESLICTKIWPVFLIYVVIFCVDNHCTCQSVKSIFLEILNIIQRTNSSGGNVQGGRVCQSVMSASKQSVSCSQHSARSATTLLSVSAGLWLSRKLNPMNNNTWQNLFDAFSWIFCWFWWCKVIYLWSSSRFSLGTNFVVVYVNDIGVLFSMWALTYCNRWFLSFKKLIYRVLKPVMMTLETNAFPL